MQPKCKEKLRGKRYQPPFFEVGMETTSANRRYAVRFAHPNCPYGQLRIPAGRCAKLAIDEKIRKMQR
jgi:hypothetical protein